MSGMLARPREATQAQSGAAEGCPAKSLVFLLQPAG